MRVLIAVVVAAVAIPIAAEELPCGTSTETIELVRQAAAWSAAKAKTVAAKGLATASVAERDGMFVVPVDVTNAPYFNPFDLAGRTLVFERSGQARFAMRNEALDWNADAGAQVTLQGPIAEPYAPVTLDFDFPFFDRTARTIYVSGNNAIYFSAPAASELRQYGDVELATQHGAVIAPLLTSRSSRLGAPAQVYVRKDSNSAAITWSVSERYSVRATLFRSGEIRFAYKDVSVPPAASAVLLTSGNEAWRTARTTLGASTDQAGDLRIAAAPPVSGMLDIVRLSVERINDLDLFELRLRTDVPIDARVAGQTLQYIITVNNQLTFRYTAYADGRVRTSTPVWGSNYASSTSRIDGNDLVITFTDEQIADVSTANIVARSYRITTNADTSVPLTVSIPVSSRSARTDFSATASTVFDGTPILEAFSLPVLSVDRVWEQVKAANPTLNDGSIDGVAIYQNFYTDLVTYAGAYSTGGNAGASGLAQGDLDALFLPRAPALMHMNTIGYGHNRTSPGASRVVLHELGHRWLLFVSLMESGSRTFALNPVSAHPAQFVDTRAAFNVYTDADTSVMGGAFFTDNGNGTFTTAGYGPYGYSWLDLYLMGLATPEEVSPMFYIADSTPSLGGEYYAPSNQTFSGTRRDFTIQNVIDATGVRSPAYPSTQREFKVVFVLLADPRRPATDDEIALVQHYRSLMETDFVRATNGRGSVSTAVEPAPSGPRRRAVRR